MRSAFRHAAAGACLVAAAASLVTGVVASSASADGSGTTAISVADATLAWEVNKQTQARSHNPAAINLLSAGIADPGRGGAELKPAQWRPVEGAVTIQKRDAAGAWQTATWDGLATDATGGPIGVSGPYSGHRVVLGAGTGTVDPTTDTARLEWKGTFSVVYYGGNSIFTATDPVLDLSAGAGTLTATLGGWDGDRNDPTVWVPAAPQRVTVADVTGVDVTPSGALATPSYGGVTVEGTVPQVRDEAGWGSFPAPMVAYLAPLGIDQFWYSTGLSTDSTKTPEPIALGWAGSAPVTPTTPAPTTRPTRTPTNAVKEPPTRSPSPSPTARPTTPQSPVPTMPDAPATPDPVVAAPVAPAPVAAPVAPAASPAMPSPVQLTAAAPVSARATEAAGAATAAPWWIGGVLLLAAALLLIVPSRTRPGPA